MRTIKVWGIERAIKMNGKWCKLGFAGQLFFRTKKLAEIEIKKQLKSDCILKNEDRIKYRAVCFELK